MPSCMEAHPSASASPIWAMTCWSRSMTARPTLPTDDIRREEDEHGRGLHILAMLSRRTEAPRGPDGKTVWCTVAVTPSTAAVDRETGVLPRSVAGKVGPAPASGLRRRDSVSPGVMGVQRGYGRWRRQVIEPASLEALGARVIEGLSKFAAPAGGGACS